MWNNNKTKDLLNYLGYAAQAIGSARDAESAADLPADLLKDVAEGYFERFPAADYLAAAGRAESFLRFISRHGNGILQQMGPHTFAFPHRTFQEYCAAMRLISEQGWPVFVWLKR